MKNNLEDKAILSEELLKAIDIIIEYAPEAIIGGSIALNAVGLLNREVKDIDLFFSLDTELQDCAFLQLTDSGIMSDTVISINGELLYRTAAKVGNANVCCFKVPDEQLQYSLFNFLGRTIKIHNVNLAIMAKAKFANVNPKHQKDLNSLEEKLKIYFPIK